MKLLLVPVLFIVACFFAGVYGALHNQISYTVSPEYFTKFKFHQFDLIHFQGRIGAAIVGWNAAWWMGAIVGIILIPVGMLIPGCKNYFWSMMFAFGVVAATTFLFGIFALLIASISVDPDTVGEFTRYNNEIVDDAAFARAGAMHNFSYLGGLVGIITGGITVLRFRRHFADLDSILGPDENAK